MKPWLSELLACPDCAGDRPLTLADAREDAGEILSGTLGCGACGGTWPVRDGIPRFVAPKDDYAATFGWQWRRWRAVQIDRLNGTRLSEDRLLRDTAWPRGWFRGRTILDVGCGAGRFADVMGALGARVVAVDLSAAVDACRETVAHHDGAVQVVQASLYALPLKRDAFDGVHCAGVIQHTPDPAHTMTALPPFLGPGGRLAYNFYERTPSGRLHLVKRALRLFTPCLPPAALLALCHGLVAVFFPLTLPLSRVRFVRYIIRFLPIAATHTPGLSVAQQYAWTLLDTFDWYSPRFERPQDHRAVAGLLRGLGLTDVEATPGITRARRE
jgi:2-polyprenyl-3-methyl-5-hydroxy-6-metoxy-1,4-benzoquinol methylase